MVETAEDLSELSRDELNDRAEEAGVEDPEDLPNKQAVIDAINEAEGNEPAEGDDTTDEPAPAPQTDVDVSTLSDELLDGETPAVLPPDARVVLAESDDVPEELWGHPALVISVNTEDPDETIYEVRTRDEHNALLYLTIDDFSQTYPGNKGVRGFGV